MRHLKVSFGGTSTVNVSYHVWICQIDQNKSRVIYFIAVRSRVLSIELLVYSCCLQETRFKAVNRANMLFYEISVQEVNYPSIQCFRALDSGYNHHQKLYSYSELEMP